MSIQPKPIISRLIVIPEANRHVPFWAFHAFYLEGEIFEEELDLPPEPILPTPAPWQTVTQGMGGIDGISSFLAHLTSWVRCGSAIDLRKQDGCQPTGY